MNSRISIVTSAVALIIVTGCTDKNKENEQEAAKWSNTHQSIQKSRIQAESDAASQARLKVTQSKRALMSMQAPPMHDMARMDLPVARQNSDKYLETPSNGVHLVMNAPYSTFSVDVDTGSYANSRSYLNMGRKPHSDAIREEAFINYFDYQYQAPENKSQPFSVDTEIAPSPWNEKRQLLRIALKGYEIPTEERKPSNLVFLVDVSGSMNEPNKLPLLIQSLSILTKELGEKDTVSLVTYAGTSSVVLEPTEGDNKKAIFKALKSLSANGGTHGESGINLAYQQAKQAYIKGGINRVILATDGDFNVGVTSLDSLKEMVASERTNGISLTTLGFGRGNYNDAMMEQLADIGQGNHAYIDTLHEARKVLLRQMSGTLQTIASDVKIQVEFNPNTVKEYRLIGYQNRILKDEDFNNDKVDAGEIGAGHTVTAFYELTLTGDKGQIDDLRYQEKSVTTEDFSGEIAQVKIRYKLPNVSDSSLVTGTVHSKEIKASFSQASSDFQFASAVAAFAQKLKDNPYIGGLSYQHIADIARKNRGADPYNYRGEFISLVDVAQSL